MADDATCENVPSVAETNVAGGGAVLSSTQPPLSSSLVSTAYTQLTVCTSRFIPAELLQSYCDNIAVTRVLIPD